MGEPTVVLAMHDGFYGAGTGAGLTNRAFLTIASQVLPADTRLVVMPIHLRPDSPEYDPDWHEAIQQILKPLKAQIVPVDNGTNGQERFGGVHAFECAGRATAELLATQILPNAGPTCIVAFDVPFVGTSTHLGPVKATTILVPRSTGLGQDPQNAERIQFERSGMSSHIANGGQVAAISRHMRSHLERDYAVPQHALLELTNGLTLDERSRLAVATDSCALPDGAESGFLLSFGRAHPVKGFDDLLDALLLIRDIGQALPHVVVAAVTEDTELNAYQRHLQERIAGSGLDVTLLTRFDVQIRSLLHHPKLRGIVVASQAEPFGRIPLEAFAAQAGPVIATRTGGLSEQVIDGVTGISVEPANPEKLATGIQRALTMTSAERDRLTRAGRQLLGTRHTYDWTVRRFLGQVMPTA